MKANSKVSPFESQEGSSRDDTETAYGGNESRKTSVFAEICRSEQICRENFYRKRVLESRATWPETEKARV